MSNHLDHRKQGVSAKRRRAFSRRLCAFLMLVVGLFAVPHSVSASDPALDQAIKTYILEHPEVIIQSLEKYQAEQVAAREERAALAVQEQRSALEADPLSPVTGNPDGDVVIVEFFDYQCGYCKRVLPVIQQVLDEDPNVRYVFKEFPVLGEASVMASRAALAVWMLDQEKYTPYHFELMKARGTLTQDRVLDIAASVGADRDAVAEKMASTEIMAILERNLQLGQSINVRGTPAFVIGGTLVPGAIDLETMQGMIASARSG